MSKARRYLDRIEGLKATAPETGAVSEDDEWDSMGGASGTSLAPGTVVRRIPASSEGSGEQNGRVKGPAAGSLPVASHTKVKTATFVKSSTALDQCIEALRHEQLVHVGAITFVVAVKIRLS